MRRLDEGGARGGQKLNQNSSLCYLVSYLLKEEIVHQVDGKVDEKAHDGERDYMKR